jgi:hypothetical protein
LYFSRTFISFPNWITEFDFIMREFTQMSLKGLAFFSILIVVGGGALHAQVLKELSGAVKTATAPAKDAQNVLKTAQQPAKDVNKTITTVEKAPQTVEKEYGRVETQADRTKKEYEKTGEKLGLGGGDKKKDSVATKADDAQPADAKVVEGTGKETEAPGRKSPVPPDFVPEKKVVPAPVASKKVVDPMDVPRPIPPGSRDNKTASGPLPASATTKAVATGGSDNAADGRNETNKGNASLSGSTPDGADHAATASSDPANNSLATDEPASRYVDLRTAPRSGEKRPKPDYSHSPARIALEKADFDIETLEDLFRFSNWEGPEREHTVRAVALSLDELQQAIVEIKKLDPGQSTWRFEEAYKDTKAAYIAEMKRVK